MSAAGPPPVPGGRSPDEREAARRDRQAQRAGGRPAAQPSEDWIDRARRLTNDHGPRRRPPAVRVKRRRVAALLLVLAVVGGIGWFALSLFEPFGGDGTKRVSVRISQGSGVGEIGKLLERKKVVSSSFFFGLRARIGGKAGELKPGSYTLREDMSSMAALDVLTSGPPADVVRVTVPEGRSRKEVAAAVPRSLRGSYLSASRRSPDFDPARYGARRVRSLEGFLFPSTYELKRGRPVRALVADQLAAFRREFAKVDLRFARSKNLTPYDVLTVASMVEREAQLPRERRLVASVIYNRLREGIPLGIDATIRYATGNWSRPLTQSQLAIQSPFNTRINRGLPPGPIGSPGVSAIRAAARPARTGFLFYVVKPGACGEHKFSRTDAEFQADVARYNRERQRRGGRSPTNC